MLIKGNDPENIKLGSTLATDEFSSLRFDFMLSNPPYGKSWQTDEKQIREKKGSKTDIIDPRAGGHRLVGSVGDNVALPVRAHRIRPP